ncbi:nucleotide exchange factor GrpE [Acidiphilium sp. AL]|uniref:Protein GrpE n=1 Tax=Acidiphilium iwatense TaxID=768198 RepID=A0ABS9DVU7_9PROT|nr:MULTISPECIES: nucleotide exchange factor GrpE [Acidiphilium]MCF3945582.1 nucleotide exchange factor GrpE [Acidiphilium iwatense]MCU4159612.1 nucleotide exchange factor GrpE [Acidiphilium sp. AL]
MTDDTLKTEPEIATGAEADEAAPESETDLLAAAQERIAKLEAETAELRDKWIRAQAEMENLRARTRREVEEARLYAVQKFAGDVAETAENLRRGLEALPAPEAGEPKLIGKLREGFEGVERSFLAMLERHGIKAEEPAGAAFDANKHQAMAEQESADAPPGTVLQAWSRTWTLNGRLLKPAMVVVAKAPADKPLDIEA